MWIVEVVKDLMKVFPFVFVLVTTVCILNTDNLHNKNNYYIS